MDNYCAPQWADFTCSPQLYSDSYFEIEHEAHKPQSLLKSTASRVIIQSEVDIVGDKTISDTTFESGTEETKNAGIETAFFVPFNSKQPPVEETIINDVLNNVMTKLKLEEQSRKLEDAWNISIEELTTRRTKLPPIAERLKASTAINAKKHSALVESKKATLANSAKEKKCIQSSSTKSKNDLFKKLETDAKDTKADPSIKGLSCEMFPIHEKRDKILAEKLPKQQPKVLTCQYRRRSIIKYRRRSNQFISLAEAISKFQNETPQRFRTISNKDLKPGPLMKLKRAPLKLTFPVSPALRCMQRVREQKQGLQPKEIKGNQIKAKPVPINILKAPSSLKKVAKKPATVIEEFNLTKPMKSRNTIHALSGSRQHLDDKERDGKDANTHATSVKMSNSSLEKENNASTERLSYNNVKPTTRASSVAFEMRNKEFQTKKDQKLKSLQETSQVKIEFHARPAPNFSKSATSAKEPNIKRAIVPRPFSFEQRDKNLAKKKGIAKQPQEDNKKLRVFYANPAPSFKSTTIHGANKDIKKYKDQEPRSMEGLGIRKTRSFVNQENKEPNVMKNSSMRLDTKEKRVRHSIMTNRLETKEFTDTVNNRNENIKTDQHKLNKTRTVAVELNTDKRAKARSEFDEKLKKKEKEEEEKRQREEENNLAREKMEVAELRKLAEVKARPMPVYKPMVILKSSKPVTSPRSPALGYKHKSKCAL